MALNLFGVTVNDAHVGNLSLDGIKLVGVRDLAAITSETEQRVTEPEIEQVQRHTEILGAYSKRAGVLPAPVGTVFRNQDAVQRWLELHYGALSDALNYVENRVAGRVHIWRPGEPSEREAGTDLAGAAAEALRVLRRSAVATLPLRVEKITGIVLSAAFLVEAELWKEFASAVEEQQKKAPSVKFELTGPWPPYDFIQMQLGA